MERHSAPTCPTCNKILVSGPDSNPKPGWCEGCWTHHDLDALEIAMAWRRLSMEDRASAVSEIGDGVIAKFSISRAEYDRVLAFSKQREATVIQHGDVSPDKQALLSLARGLSDPGALSEMIDNALDCAQRKRDGALVTVTIDFNFSQGMLCVTDDAGGMTPTELLRCLTLGSQSPDGHGKNVIGRFGVGAKEAIYHFGREVSIRTRDLNADGIATFLPATWLNERSWDVTIVSAEATAGSSTFEIGVLDRFDYDKDLIKRELADRYQKSIEAGRLSIILDGATVGESKSSSVLLYPPELYPRRYNFWVRSVMVELDVAMLAKEAKASGVYFYFFGRRFAHWAWTDSLARTIFEKPPQSRLNSHFRVEINFNGPIDDIPINANKDEVDTSKEVYRTLARMVSKIVQPYLSIINWLSKDNAMGYLQRNFSGPENRHASVTETSPGYDKPIELGKIYDSMTLQKPRAADHTVLIETIRKERFPITEDHAGSARSVEEQTDSSGKNADVPRDPREATVERPGPASRPPAVKEKYGSPVPEVSHLSPSAILTVSLFAAEIGDVERFKVQLARTAENLGIDLKIT